jgi:predicted nuclease of predicted toxin-antitoxin system
LAYAAELAHEGLAGATDVRILAQIQIENQILLTMDKGVATKIELWHKKAIKIDTRLILLNLLK